MARPSDGDLLDLSGCAQLLGVPRWRLWWLARTGRFAEARSVQDGGSSWTRASVYSWAADPAVGLAAQVPVRHWPAAQAPASYLGGREVAEGSAIALRWRTAAGVLAMVWPLSGQTFRFRHVGSDLRDAAGIAVVEWDFGVTGPAVTDVGGGGRGEIGWRTLAKVIGRPLPYWPSSLRIGRLMLGWSPGQETVTTPVKLPLDTAALLRLAASYEDGHPAARTLLNLAQTCQHRETESTEQILKILAKTADEDTVVVAARPMAVPPADTDDLDVHQRRAGWLDVLSRQDTLAADCVRALMSWDNGEDLPYGSIEEADPARPLVAEWAGRLKPSPRAAAFEIFGRDGVVFIDPETDAPALRSVTEDGDRIFLASPQRLPTTSPLAELILDEPIWARTADGTLYPAPQDAQYGLSWGYAGTGPGCLAELIDRLLDDITAPGADLSQSPPESLVQLTALKLPHGTVLTRAQLEAARAGSWLPDVADAEDGQI